MTHEYTLLLGGRVIPGGDAPEGTAIAWAADTILAIGSDEEVRSLSRGDSRFVELGGATVIPLSSGEARWPPSNTLELGGEASFAVLPRLPAGGKPPEPIALVVAGRLVAGSLTGTARQSG